MTEVDSIRELTAHIREFAVERDWEKFHDPKSLVLALVGEIGELAELFQWIDAEDAINIFLAPERKARVEEELSDVFTYLLRLADVLQVDLGHAAYSKLVASRQRFPAAEVRGVAPTKD